MHFRKSLHYGIAAMLGLCVLGSMAQAQQPRSPIERRQQPNGGFWQKQSSVTRSINNTSAIRGFNSGSAIVRNVQPYNNPRSYANAPAIVRTPAVSNGALVGQYPVNRAMVPTPTNPGRVVTQATPATPVLQGTQATIVNPIPVYRVGCDVHSIGPQY